MKVVTWTRGHSQEGLRRKGQKELIGDRGFERTGTLDIGKITKPRNPKLSRGKVTVKCRRPCG
jgi:hypothetical protein